MGPFGLFRFDVSEARRAEGVIHQLLQGVEILAKPSEEWQKDLMQKAGEVPLEMMRGDVSLGDIKVWQLDKRAYVDICRGLIRAHVESKKWL